ncbi:MAG: M50 family metallopeptidase, partial [Candidatus Hodarchaeales archaeon]
MFSFNSREKQELIIGTLIFVFVGLTLFVNPLVFDYSVDFNLIFNLIILACLIFPLWLFHELAHKFVAQYYGLYSEFRLYPNFALISLLSAFLPFKFIAPGVVHHSGRFTPDTPARTAMAGPLVNILLGGGFLTLAAISNEYWLNFFLITSFLSINLALFNLLPFFVLDGAKIFNWNKSVYSTIFGLTLLFYLFHPFGVDWRFIIGIIGIVISSLLIYMLIIYPGRNKRRILRRDHRVSNTYSTNFKPNIIRPSVRAKKTIVEGSCHFCDKPALMGFTCSY